MKRSSGFTVIEIIVVIVVLFGASLLFFQQKSNIEATARDDKRKSDINTIYHNLEKVYYAKNHAYPSTVDGTTLPAVPDDIFKDPDGVPVNSTRTSNLGITTTPSTYSYDPANCRGDVCGSYTLRANLEKEADYVKKSVHNETPSTDDKNNKK